jgi:hypothetical protein
MRKKLWSVKLESIIYFNQSIFKIYCMKLYERKFSTSTSTQYSHTNQYTCHYQDLKKKRPLIRVEIKELNKKEKI